MKKIIVTSLMTFGMLGFGLFLNSTKVHAGMSSLIGGGADACNYTVVKGSSGFVFDGAGTVYGIILSTGNGVTGSVLVDTRTAASSFNAGFDPNNSIWASNSATPLLAHSSSTVLNGVNTSNSDYSLAGGKGVRMQQGAAIVGNGAANSVGVYWKK